MLTLQTAWNWTKRTGRWLTGLVFALVLLLGTALGEGLDIRVPDVLQTGQELVFGIRYEGEDSTCDLTVSATALYANGTAALLKAERKTLLRDREWTVTLSVPYACRIHLEADGETDTGEACHREIFAEVTGEGADWPEMTLEGPESCLTGEETVFSMTPAGGVPPYTVRLTATLPRSGETAQTWRSDGETVLGIFSFAEAGTVRIEAEATDARGLKAYAERTVECAEAPFRLEADRTDLTEGESVGLRILREGAEWAFESSDPGVAAVDENGRVTAAGAGTAVVTAADGNGAAASLMFRVSPEAEGLSVEGLHLQKGQTGQLRPAVTPAGASLHFLYLSADETVAWADEQGVVHAEGPGRTAVTVIAVEKPSLSVTAEVVVADEAEERVLACVYGLFFSGNGSGGELAAAFDALSAGPCSFTLSLERDGQVLSVKTREEGGVIRFYLPDPAPGTYRISVTARDESGCLSTAAAEGVLSDSAEGALGLEVTREEEAPILVEKLCLRGPEVVYVGQSVPYTLEKTPAGALDRFRWESLEPAVASVDGNGVLTVHQEGFTVLSVSALDGSGAKAELTVSCLRESLGVGAEEIVIHRGDSLTLDVVSSTGRIYDYVFTPSDPAMFSVLDGVLTALEEGRGTLHIACAGGECETTVPVRVTACLHREGTWRVTREATCVRDGERTFVCAFCGETAVTEAIPAPGHDAGRWSTRVPATPRYPGERIRCCTRCGAVLERDGLPCITGTTYNLNTACSEGFSFRDLFGVKEWYMFTPLDVSRDGVQTIRLIAGNMYQIGTVYVTVLDGRICVTYQLVDPALKFSDEFITFLPGLWAFRGADPAFYRNFAFGVWYGLEEDLECGDGLVMLFIRNRLNYDKSVPGLVQFGEEQPTHIEYLRRLIWMLDRRCGA